MDNAPDRLNVLMTDQTRSLDNVTSSQSIAEAFWKRAAQTPDTVLYRSAIASSPSGTRVWRTETYLTVAPKIARLAHFLRSLGVSVGTPVAILSQTREEWMLADIAIQTLGGITVSAYQSLPAQEVGYLLFDSGASIIFVENEEQGEKIQALRDSPCPIPEREGYAATEVQVEVQRVISFETIESVADAIAFSEIVQSATLPSSPPAVPSELSRTSIASYVYTSGTTGPPKGVIQTHGNHLTNVAQVSHAGVFLLDGSLFLYLPLAHSFARLAYYVGFLTSTSLVLPAIADRKSSRIDLQGVARDLQEGAPSVLPSVPRLFEKMAAAIQAKASGKGLATQLMRITISNAQRVYRARQNKERLSLLDQILFNGLEGIRTKIKHRLFGARFSHGISGGAKLDPEVNRFFDALGITICEGYGLTETCVATHVNLPDRRKIGSVGPALEGVEVKICPEDQEIALRGPNITQGYLHRQKATAEAWDHDGWFHTGDIGRLDDDGFLYITDRKKELVITAGGKKISPQSVEGLFKRYPFISQSLYYGDGKPHCVMLFTLNEIELREILRHRGVHYSAHTKLGELPETMKMVQDAVDAANTKLASFETIKRFAILPEDFTIEGGLLTPTMKMKRKVIVARYRDTIESLYQGH